MRPVLSLTLCALGIGLAFAAQAATTPPGKDDAQKPIEITADQSLEWYQSQHVYVARGHAKAVRGDMVVEADLLTAHERDKSAAATSPKPSAEPAADKVGGGDLDKLTAEGHVRITDPRFRALGDRAVYDFDTHAIVMTGKDLRYETEKQVVTAKDALEYYDDKKIAVARGHAAEDEANRHIEADILTAEFRNGADDNNALTKVTAEGHVTVVTRSDVARGDRAVYDVARNIAIISGHVRITRPNGLELTGDVGEVDFAANQSRLLNTGHGRVRALLPMNAAGTAEHHPTKGEAE